MIAAPVLVSLFAGISCLVLGRSVLAVRLISILCSIAVCMLAIINFRDVYLFGGRTLQMGSWPAPFAISFSLQGLAALLVAVSSCVALAGNMAFQIVLSNKYERRSFHCFFHFMMAGVLGAFATGDLFNLYVWFEVFLIASFFLVSLSGQRTSLSGGFKYAVLSVLSSLVFLLGIAFVYASVGTLDIQDFHRQLHAQSQNLGAQVGLSLLVGAFAVKAAFFPFFFWLPASYPATVTVVAAVLSGFLTKVGVYGILRLLLPVLDIGGHVKLLPLLFIISLFSMVLGVLGALSRDNMKAILAFHSISQIGYMGLGFSLGTTAGAVACVFYVIHHMLVKTNLFFAVAYMEGTTGTPRVSESGGLWIARPFLGMSFAFSALALVGVPPLSGFWAKVATLQAALATDSWFAVALCLVVSLFTLMSMLKIWLGVFWRRPTASLLEGKQARRVRWLILPLLFVNLGVLGMSLGSSRLMKIIERSVMELSTGGP